ncbi:MAG: hypothetical protein P4L33_06890 [Capsulimonadaceae bacterium]|nr:hypothetical protein [Capsulimonadaceae bacterium]
MQNITKGIIIVALLALVIGVNNQLNRVSPKSEHDDDNDGAQVSGNAPTPAVKTPPAKAPAAAAADNPIDEAVVGPANAPVTITVGYGWTPELQSDPAPLAQVIAQAKQWGAQPGHCARIVCVDVPSSVRAPGDKAPDAPGVYVSGAKPAQISGYPGADIKPDAFSHLLTTVK